MTLAREDGQQVEAHKVILAASSPFLEKNKHTHPLFYLRFFKLMNFPLANQTTQELYKYII